MKNMRKEGGFGGPLDFFILLLLSGIVLSVIGSVQYFSDRDNEIENKKRLSSHEYTNKVLKIKYEYLHPEMDPDYEKSNGTVTNLKSTYTMDKDGIEEIAEDSRKPLLKILDIDITKNSGVKKLTKEEIYRGKVIIRSVDIKNNVLKVQLSATLQDSYGYKDEEIVEMTRFEDIDMVATDMRNIVLGSLSKFGDKVDVHVTLGKVVKDEYNKEKFVKYKMLLNDTHEIYSDYLIKSSDFKKIEDFDTYTMRQLNKLNQVRFD